MTHNVIQKSISRGVCQIVDISLSNSNCLLSCSFLMAADDDKACAELITGYSNHDTAVDNDGTNGYKVDGKRLGYL